MPWTETGWTDPAATWETACQCGTRYCRSGWPAEAPLPAELPDPLRYLNQQRALTRGLPELDAGQRLAQHQAREDPERGLEAGQ